jgi:uncharacterized membrane protein YsdA (DUF1294 family)/cold shock CspA family protein
MNNCIEAKQPIHYSHLKGRNSKMRSRKAPRYQGKINSWKDDQGFGFIAPNGGGPAVFVHIKSFANRRHRPAPGDIVTYDLTTNEKGQPRAENVEFVRDRVSPPGSPRMGAKVALVVAASFLGVIGLFVLIGRLPSLVLGLYVGFSVLAFVAYGVDKSAARNGRWRTKESTLHMLALAGGWPGALMAQHVYRHKSKKQSFRMGFWFTVVVNCGALAWLLSRGGASALRPILGSA